MNKANYLKINSVFVNEGIEVNCRYLTINEFDHNNNLCQVLHYCFCCYSEVKGYASVMYARLAIETFLEFRVEFNKNNPRELQLNHITDLFTEPLKVYLLYLQKNKKKIKAIYSLRTLLNSMLEYDEEFPLILFPKLPKLKSKPNEALEDQAIDSLDTALKHHMNYLHDKLEYRKLVHEAEAYSFDDVMEQCFPSGTKKNIFEWYRFALANNKAPSKIQIAGKLKQVNNLDEEIAALLTSADPKSSFEELYKNESADYLGDKSYNPFEKQGIRAWKPEYTRVLKTFSDHNYPFCMDYDNVLKIHTNSTNSIDECTDIISLLLHRFTVARPISKIRINTGVPVLKLDELINLYYPNQKDMASIMLLLQFQAGWNKETVINLDPDEFEHSMSGVIDENQRLISSEKNRGQGGNLPYSNPKPMLAVSDTKDKYSIINIIKLSIELSKPLSSLRQEEAQTLNKKYSPVFCCTVDFSDWGKKSRYSTLGNTKTSTRGVRDFLKTYEITHAGKRLLQSSDIVSKLRPSWVYLKRKTDPLSLVQLAAGHTSPITTDVHYDNSPQSQKNRKARLSQKIKQLYDRLRERKFKGLLPAELKERTSINNITIFSIPGHQRELWACKNQTEPTWKGKELFLEKGEKCFFMNKCLICKNIALFTDSLPYILERFEYLEYCELNMPNIEFSLLLQDEYDVLKWLIDNWGNDEEIKSARIFLRRNRPLLPKDLASLISLMKTLTTVNQNKF